MSIAGKVTIVRDKPTAKHTKTRFVSNMEVTIGLGASRPDKESDTLLAERRAIRY